MNHQTPYPTAFSQPKLAGLRILKLIVGKSGTYNQPYYRPYQTHFDAETAELLSRRLDDHGMNATTTSVMAGMANRIMMPAAQHAGPVPIVNGWATPRGRFNMIVEVTLSSGSILFYHIQGYTSHYETSLQGTPDPDMQFYINSMTRTSRVHVMGPNGVETRETVSESVQVINGRLVSNQLNSEIYGLRPHEIFSVMQGDLLRAEYHTLDSRDAVFDHRHSLSNQASPSSRSNNMPACMLARIVDNYQIGQGMREYGQGQRDLLGQVKGYVHDGILQENYFLRQLSNVTGIPETTSFSMKELVAIDPNVLHPSVQVFIKLDNQGLAKLNYAGQSEQWHSPDRSSWVSTALANAVPTIMMEMMITELAFTANNHDTAGNNHVYIAGARDMLGRNITHNLNIFKQRFMKEVMFDLTYGNQVSYMLTMTVNLLSDMVIDIAYENSPMTRYVVPSFCDSLIVPVLTTDERLVHNNAHDISMILNNIQNVMPTTAVNGIV